MKKLAIGAPTGFGLHRFKARLGMIVFTVFLASSFVKFGQSKFLEFSTHFRVVLSTIFPESALIRGKVVTYI